MASTQMATAPVDFAAILASFKLSSIYVDTLEECRDMMSDAQRLNQLGNSDKDQTFIAMCQSMVRYVGIFFSILSGMLKTTGAALSLVWKMR